MALSWDCNQIPQCINGLCELCGGGDGICFAKLLIHLCVPTIIPFTKPDFLEYKHCCLVPARVYSQTQPKNVLHMESQPTYPLFFFLHIFGYKIFFIVQHWPFYSHCFEKFGCNFVIWQLLGFKFSYSAPQWKQPCQLGVPFISSIHRRHSS